MMGAQLNGNAENNRENIWRFKSWEIDHIILTQSGMEYDAY